MFRLVSFFLFLFVRCRCERTGVHEGHKVDKEDHVRGGARAASADPHVAYHREAPRPVLQLPQPLRGPDGELAQPAWTTAEVSNNSIPQLGSLWEVVVVVAAGSG